MLKPHGLRGDLRVQPFNPASPHLRPKGVVHLAGQQYEITRVREDRGQLLIQLDGFRRRSQVEDARGQLLEVPEDELVQEEGAHYIHELVGLLVVTDDGREIGRVIDVLDTGANDVYVVEGEGGEVLIPAIRDVVQEIDLAGGRLRITALPGMLDDPA